MADTNLHRTLDEVVGASHWTTLEAVGPVGTAAKHKKALSKLAPLAGGALSELVVEARDERDERETLILIGEHTITVETEKGEVLDDDAIAGLSAALRAVGSPMRFAWVEAGGEAGLACLSPDQREALAGRGLKVSVLEPDEEDGEDGGGLAGWRRPTKADVSGVSGDGDDRKGHKVAGPARIGPVEFRGGAVVTFDGDGAVDQVRQQKGPLKVEATFAGAPVTVMLKGRAELRDRTWKAWGTLAKDLKWDGGELHKGDEIDIVDGQVAGVVLSAPGTLNGRGRKAGAVIDVERTRR